MSTRSNVHFVGYGGRLCANVYVHSDGYPEHSVPRLFRFFDAVAAQTSDTRFGDPTYLAAKFVVWAALYEFNNGQTVYDFERTAGTMKVTENHAAWKESPLDFISVGVVTEDAGDGEYVYEVDCDKQDADGYPTVRGRHAGGKAFQTARYREKAKAHA